MLSFYKMKRTLFLFFFSLFFTFNAFGQDIATAPYLPAQSAQTSSSAPITVQYPHEKMTVSRGAKKIFIFGKLNLKDPVLDINGESIPVRKNGTFIAFLPVENGDFEFLLTAQSEGKTYQAKRTVTVPGMPIKKLFEKAEFDPEEVYPQSPVELIPGDLIELSVRGTPRTEVSYTLSGLKGAKNIVMKEDSSIPGVYRAKYLIAQDQKPKTVKVTYRMKNAPGNTKAKITAPGRIKILDAKNPFTTAEITLPGIKLRKIPVKKENLYPFYRAYGRVQLNGLSNGLYRIALNENESAWLEANRLKIRSFGSYEENYINEMTSSVTEAKTRLSFQGLREVPIQVQEFNDRFELTFYYTRGFGENYSLDTTSPVVDMVEWTYPAKDTVKFIIHFKKDASLWGHGYDFENGTLLLDLMHKPRLTPQKNQPLKGARILIDAGHSPKRTVPYDGAVGPTGYLEYEANLALAQDVEKLLKSAGAEVIMTRRGNNHISLQGRYNKAIKENAHIFVSIHYNALPETLNPLSRPRGYSVYYNYPHSLPLAKAVYEAFNRYVPLPDNGLIANDILFIPRIPQFPSILVENAYIILPEQEEMAQSPAGRAKFAKAIYQGILNFYYPKLQNAAKPKGKRVPRRRSKPRF